MESNLGGQQYELKKYGDIENATIQLQGQLGDMEDDSALKKRFFTQDRKNFDSFKAIRGLDDANPRSTSPNLRTDRFTSP